MELRSYTKKQKPKTDEYKLMQLTLSELGYYEENMDMAEMQEILEALQLSECAAVKGTVSPAGSGSRNYNFKQHRGNSTILQPSRQSADSPEQHFEILTVQALVHHPMDWSPNEKSSPEDTMERSPFKRCIEASDGHFAKRLCFTSIEAAPDSGLCVSATASNTSPEVHHEQISESSDAIEWDFGETENFEPPSSSTIFPPEEIEIDEVQKSESSETAVQTP